jgi:serine/threonine protein kinase
MHCDLKSLNLLLSSEWLLKLADFGESSMVTDLAGHVPGVTANWSAPEVLRSEPYTWMSDVYSLAMCVYEIHTGVIPYHNIKSRFTIARRVEEGVRPAIDANTTMPKSMQELVLQSWEGDPTQRPTIEQWLSCAEQHVNADDRRSNSERLQSTNTDCNRFKSNSDGRELHTAELIKDIEERESFGFSLATHPSPSSRQLLQKAVADRRRQLGKEKHGGWSGWNAFTAILPSSSAKRSRSASVPTEKTGVALVPLPPTSAQRAQSGLR